MFQNIIIKKYKGERVRVADGKRAKENTLTPSLIGRGYGGGFIKNILLSSTIIILLLSAKSFAAPALQIDKNINLSVNSSHLLTFDEKIIRYKFVNEKDFKAEILSNLFNTRQELLIKPLNNSNNKLTVWTESKIYNINFEFEQNPELKIREIDEKESLINKSPVLSEETSGITDFELDNPPKIKKERGTKGSQGFVKL
ncbi:MAG TPA: hypothetical protein DDW90_09325 [Cyanobacteria bacterium UBA9971]|nr:hypothetical protein [Cyanobacteria bacterium UBA9971]